MLLRILSGFGDFRRVVCGVHHRLSDFVHAVVVCRRDEAIREWRNWLREDPMVHPKRWLRPDLVPPAPFVQCEPHLTLGSSFVLADKASIDEEFRKAWLPYFCRSGQSLFLGLMSLLVFLPRLKILVFGLVGCWMLVLP